MYIAVGSNNFWYAEDTSKSRIRAEVKRILAGEDEGYADPESGHEPSIPDHIAIYGVVSVETLDRPEEESVAEEPYREIVVEEDRYKEYRWLVRFYDDNGHSILARTRTEKQADARAKYHRGVLEGGRLLRPDKSV